MEQSRRDFVKRALAITASTSLGWSEAPGASTYSAASSGTRFEVKASSETPQQQIPPYIFADNFVERRNMAWRVEAGQLAPGNPLLTGQYPWDESTPFYSGTVLKDPIDGLWKCWGISVPKYANHQWGEWDFRLGYATSEDGIRWLRPMLDGFPCLGHEKSNVLLDFPDGGSCFQMSVLVDPQAEPSRRYEMFILRNPRYKNPSRHVKDLPIRPEYREGHPWGVYRYFSADGIHWKVAEGPLKIESADSLFIYRDIGAPYVAYHKMGPVAPPGSAYVPYDSGVGEIRIIVRRESQDGTHWSDPPLTVMTPDWRDAQDTQFMDLGPLRQGSGYVATVAVFHALNQSMDIQFTGSPDGKRWFRPIPRRACVSNGPLGEIGGGHIFQCHRLVEDGDQLHLYYAGMEGLHSDLYTEVSKQRIGTLGQEAAYPYGGLCRASWQRGRLWAVVPAAAGPSQAIVTTPPNHDSGGRTLFINAMTLEGGELSAELLTSDKSPVSGFRREDCRVFRGDSQCIPLTWQGGSRCPKNGLMIRIHIRRARLYGFEWR